MEVRPIHGGLGATLHAQLRQQTRDLVLDGFFSEEQSFADVSIGQPIADQTEDLAFASGEGRQALIVRRSVA
jgi:hypothetical protein